MPPQTGKQEAIQMRDLFGTCWALAHAAAITMAFGPACVAGHEDPAPAGARRHCSIEILVQDPTGASVPDAYVHLSGPTDKRGRTDAEGRFCAEAGRSGRYLAVVEKTGFGKASDSFTLEEAAGGRVIEIRPAAVRLAIDVVAAPELASESVERITASLLETPRSVAVFDAIQLRERNFRTVHDLLAFVPGLSPNSLRAGGYHYYARGFRMLPEDTRVDGAAGVTMGGGYSAPTFGVEQVVLLKGPAGLFYGPASSPGGLINLITKKPQPVRSTQLDLRGPPPYDFLGH
jgi:hypothetical protein